MRTPAAHDAPAKRRPSARGPRRGWPGAATPNFVPCSVRICTRVHHPDISAFSRLQPQINCWHARMSTYLYAFSPTYLKWSAAATICTFRRMASAAASTRILLSSTGLTPQNFPVSFSARPRLLACSGANKIGCSAAVIAHRMHVPRGRAANACNGQSILLHRGLGASRLK